MRIGGSMKLIWWLFRVALVYCGSVLLLFSIIEWTELNDRRELPVLLPQRHNKEELFNATTVSPPTSTVDLQNVFGRTDDKWVRVAHSIFQVFVFSAYLDMRISDFRLARTPAVRLPIIMETALRRHWLQKPSMFICYFPSLNVSVHAHLYEQCENHDQIYGAYIVNCLVDRSWTNNLSSVQLRPSTSARHDDHHEIFISKTLVETQLSPYNTTVCVHTPIFGRAYSPEYIIRYVELTRLLGADHFIFYIANRSEEHFEDQVLLNVFHKYEAAGLATVIDFRLPMERRSGIWYHGQSAAVQDCVYRSIGGTNFLILTDLDEFLVPVAPVDWHSMFEQLWASRPNATGFHVQPLYFAYPQWKKRAEFSPFIRFEEAASESPLRTSLTKCVVRPERVFEMGIHHISKQFHEHFSNEQLNKSVARLYHYKRQQSMNPHPSKPLTTNKIMLRYKNDFDLRVDKVLYKYL